jgi:hypothetical protein
LLAGADGGQQLMLLTDGTRVLQQAMDPGGHLSTMPAVLFKRVLV